MITLNQQIEILKNFTSKHRGLNSYFHEGINKLEENVDSPVYPKFESVLESMDNTSDMFSCKFRLFVSDLVNKDKTNRDIVISDCSQVANDFLYYMKKIVRDGTFPAFRCSTDIQLTDYLEAGVDEEAGVYFEFTMTGHIGNYSCNLPIDTGTILDNNYIYVYGNTTPITSTMNITTETFTYAGSPITLANTPIDILTVFADASVQFETADYTRVTSIITPTSPIVENGTIIRITYTY